VANPLHASGRFAEIDRTAFLEFCDGVIVNDAIHEPFHSKQSLRRWTCLARSHRVERVDSWLVLGRSPWLRHALNGGRRDLAGMEIPEGAD
jgi:hypothetical protein